MQNKSPLPTGFSSTVSPQPLRFRPAAGLDVLPRMKIGNETFAWPIWLLPVIIGAPLMIYPRGTCRSLGSLEDGIYILVYLLVSLRYLRGWKRGGNMIDLIIYSTIGFSVPYLTSSFLRLLSLTLPG